MQIVVLANGLQKKELAGAAADQVVWIENEAAFFDHERADVFIDLLYNGTPERKELLARLQPGLVVVNSVAEPLKEIPAAVRINGWNTFLSSPVLEAACCNEAVKETIVQAFAPFSKKLEWLPDEPGFVTARVVSMIINEAYLALDEGVSTKEEIDTAMKLGTAYPFGPFEWAQNIGLQNVAALLQALSRSQPQYAPAPLLLQEAGEIS